jgi:hypothetical protein
VIYTAKSEHPHDPQLASDFGRIQDLMRAQHSQVIRHITEKTAQVYSAS